ncbi:phosphopantetheine-binding protein [Streptomyces sp. R44]|uniref:Phosphopantetheine-binding protein n=1 Tax=Streptomyces sp. R44 TaxID=3238633 RepID=A0AB39TCG0_9ACTN
MPRVTGRSTSRTRSRRPRSFSSRTCCCGRSIALHAVGPPRSRPEASSSGGRGVRLTRPGDDQARRARSCGAVPTLRIMAKLTNEQALSAVIKAITAVAQIPQEAIEPDSQLTDLGVDSIQIMQIAAQLESELSVGLLASDSRTPQTPREYAEHLIAAQPADA